jgi:hypothetical protein
VKSQLPVARWQSSTARVSNGVPSSRGTSVVAVLLAADETPTPTIGIRSQHQTDARDCRRQPHHRNSFRAESEQNLRRGYSS